MKNGILALAPADEYDLDPMGMFGPMGIFGPGDDISAVINKMDRQFHELQQLADQEMVPEGERQVSVTHPAQALGFLKDIYELGDDGQVHFKARFNVTGFAPEDIKVTASKNRLNILAKSHEKTPTSEKRRELCRTIYLPSSVDHDQLKCHFMSDGVLSVEAPLRGPDYEKLTFDKDHHLSIRPHATSEGQHKEKAMVPKPTGHYGVTMLPDGDRKKLHVEFPVEKCFDGKNISVRTEANELVVTGTQEVVEGTGPNRSVHRKEFSRSYTIPETVDPMSINAQLIDNVLVVEAPLIHTK
jgi:HSP20 family molecular chaperone IbpA